MLQAKVLPVLFDWGFFIDFGLWLTRCVLGTPENLKYCPNCFNVDIDCHEPRQNDIEMVVARSFGLT
jgi:hypothetical protein